MKTKLKLEEDAINNFKQSEKAYREFIHTPIHTGQGILEQINSSYSKEIEGSEQGSSFFIHCKR
jgi:hypothetical protein